MDQLLKSWEILSGSQVFSHYWFWSNTIPPISLSYCPTFLDEHTVYCIKLKANREITL